MTPTNSQNGSPQRRRDLAQPIQAQPKGTAAARFGGLHNAFTGSAKIKPMSPVKKEMLAGSPHQWNEDEGAPSAVVPISSHPPDLSPDIDLMIDSQAMPDTPQDSRDGLVPRSVSTVATVFFGYSGIDRRRSSIIPSITSTRTYLVIELDGRLCNASCNIVPGHLPTSMPNAAQPC